MRTIATVPFHRFSYFLLVLLLPTQLGYHFWPSWALVLGRQVDYLSPTIFVTDILVFVTVVSWLLSGPQKDQRKIGPGITHKKMLLLMLGLLLLSNVFFSLSPLNAVIGWAKVIEYCCLALYIIRTHPSQMKTAGLLMVSASLSIGLGLVQVVHGGSIGGLFWWIGERTFEISTPGIAKTIFCFPSFSPLYPSSCLHFLRPYATLPHPNVLAGFAGSVLLIFFPFLSQSLRYRITFFLYLLLCFLLLALTSSRTSFIALIATGMLFFITHKNVKQILIFGTMAAFTLITLPVTPKFLPGYESLTIRQSLVDSAIQIIARFPLFGVGLHNFLVALPDALVSRSIYFLQPVHNIFLLALCELGILGMGVVFLLLLPFLRIFHTSIFIKGDFYKNQSEHFYWQYPLLFLLLTGFWDHYIMTLQQGQLLLTLVVSFFILQHRLPYPRQ